MNKLKVAIYLRLSDEDKNKINKLDDSESIKNQRNLLLEEINKHPNYVLIDEYCDEDLSGAGTYRPEFERLINDCKKGKIDIVLCKSQSRFSRDMEIIEKYLHNKFIEWNIRFIGLSDNTDTENKGNKKARQINGLVNEWYLEDVSNNIRSAFQAKMMQGEYISPFASFGYEISKNNNNKLVIDKIASLIVKDIYKLYLQGMGFSKIAKYLNDNKIPSPSFYKYKKGIKLNINTNKKREDVKWSSNAIKSILTNELYIGNLIQGKRTTISYKNHKIIKKNKQDWIKIENTHEAIIDKKDFLKVQNIINKKIRPIKNGSIHIFSKKVFCLECNNCMKKKNSTKYEYLICSNTNCINNKAIRYDVLENIILNKLNIIIDKYFNIKMLNNLNLDMINNNLLLSLNKQKDNIIKEINKKEIYFKNLYEDKVNNIITKIQFKNLINEYNIDINLLKKELNILNNKINKYKNNFKKNNLLFNKYKKINKLNKIIIDEFIDKIYISKLNKNKREIKIKWNF